MWPWPYGPDLPAGWPNGFDQAAFEASWPGNPDWLVWVLILVECLVCNALNIVSALPGFEDTNEFGRRVVHRPGSWREMKWVYDISSVGEE